MTKAFGDTPHVIVSLRNASPADHPDVHAAIAQTDGGVLVVGIGYDPTAVREAEPADVSATIRIDDGEGAAKLLTSYEDCPECGSTAAHPISETRSNLRTVELLLCEECATAWEIRT